MDLTEIEGYLITMGLSPDQLPTLEEYKLAYREKLKMHPDKLPDSADKKKDHDVFCEILKAAECFFQYITENQNQQTREKDQDKELLKTFEQRSGVSYNKGNITFNIEPGSGDLWIKCLAKKLSEPVLLSNGSVYQMKVKEFKITSVSYLTKKTYGSLSVTVWPSPSDGQPKVCVQGTMYLAFVSFVLPTVLKDMSDIKAIAGTSDVSEDDGLNESEATDFTKLAGALQRLEKEVLKIGNTVANKVDIALPNVTPEPTIGNLINRVANLEEMLKANQEQFSGLAKAMEKLNSTIAAQGATGLGEINKTFLTEAVHSHPFYSNIEDTFNKLKTDVAKAGDLELVEQHLVENKEALKVVDSTTEATCTSIQDVNEKFSTSISASDKEISQLRINSDESLKMFGSMKTSLEHIVKNSTNPGPAPKHPPPSEH